jgi:DNA-binding SARP family transcriptional activator
MGASWRLYVRLFGHVEIDVDDAPFRLAAPRRTLSLLTYLVLHRTSAVERDFLSYLLWPDEEESVAHTKLRSSLFALARVLPPRPDGWIEARKDMLAWRKDAEIEVDVERFEALARDPATLQRAVELYRGDLAPALYDEWLDEPRERLRTLYLTSLYRLAGAARRRRDFPLAIASARRILAIDPWREDIVRRLMAFYYESGDRAGALAEYRSFTERLRTEMSVAPMPETQMLMESIVRDAGVAEDALESDGREHVRVSALPAVPFVGRTAELGLALECWEAATRGAGQLVGIGGEAGIGKTRLARELAHAIEERGGRVLWGATGRPEGTPYEPLVDALRSALPLLAAAPLAPNVAAALAALVPELGARLSDLPALVPLDPQAERQRLFDALGTALVLLTKTRPVVIVLEDLQWAGEATLEALDSLAKRLRSARSALIVTYREEEIARNHPLRRMLREGTHGVTTIGLGPIGVDAVETLLETRTGLEVVNSPELIHERAGGNPLFVVQLLARGEPLAAGALPDTLASLIVERLAALSADAATLAEVAAAIGERFSLEVASEVLGWHHGATLRALDELIDRRIVRERSARGGPGLFPYAFDHQLIQQAIDDSAPPERGVARHRRIAMVLDALFADRKDELAGEIARHYDRGNEPAAAVAHYLAASKHASSLGASDEANGFVDRGLELASDDSVRVDLLMMRETLSDRAGTPETRLATLDELTKLARAREDVELLCDVLSRRARFMFRHADTTAQRHAIEELRAEATRANALVWLARADLRDAYRLEIAEDISAAIDAASQARARFLALGDASGAAEAASQQACVLADAGRHAEARAALDDALALAERGGSYMSKSQALFAATAVAMMCGDPAAMLASGERWLALTSAAGDARAAVRARGQIAIAQANGLALGAALRSFNEVIGLAQELGMPLVYNSHLGNRAEVFATIGDLASAAEGLERARSLSLTRGNRRAASGFAADLCLVLAHAGQVEPALARGREALDWFVRSEQPMMQAFALEHLSEAEFLSGDCSTARAHASDALRLRRTFGGPFHVGYGRALAAWYALAADDIEGAVEALDTLSGEGPGAFAGACWPERVAWHAACVYHAAGRTSDAARWLARTSGLLHEMRASLSDHPALLPAFDALPWRAQIANAPERWETAPRIG